MDHHENHNGSRHVPSPGYETSSSTAPTTSPDLIDYRQFDSHRYNNGSNHNNKKAGESVQQQKSSASKESTPELAKFVAKRPSVTKIEDRLVNFELKSSTSESSEAAAVAKADMPKVDILKRREMFEKDKPRGEKDHRSSGDFSSATTPMITIKERLSNLERQKEDVNNNAAAKNQFSGDITSIKDRLKNLEKEKSGSHQPTSNGVSNKIDVPLGGSIKDRLSSLHSATTTTATSVTKVDVVVEPATVERTVATTKSAVIVGMAKKPVVKPVTTPIADVEEDQVIQVETLKVAIEQIQLTTTEGDNSSLMTLDSIQDTVQDYVTIMQDVKEKDEYREITDEDLFGGTDIDDDCRAAEGTTTVDKLQQQDMSVSSASGTVVSVGRLIEADSLENLSLGSISSSASGTGNELTVGGTPVIETLTLLGSLLERSASNNNVAAVVNAPGVIKGGGGTGEEEVVVDNELKMMKKKKPAVNPKPQPPPPTIMAMSRSENSLANRANNNNHHRHQVAKAHQQPLKSSQSAFFDSNSGDRYCVLLINNSRGRNDGQA